MLYKIRMRDLTDSPKLQGQSCPEIADWVANEAKRLGRKGIKWKRRVSQGPLLNFVMAWYMTLTPSEREKIAKDGHAKLTDILNQPAPEEAEVPEVPPKISKANGRGGSAKSLPNNRDANKAVGKHLAGLLH